MSAYQVLMDAAARAGWRKESMLQVACQYIDNQGSEDAFVDHVERQIAEEQQLGLEAGMDEEDIEE